MLPPPSVELNDTPRMTVARDAHLAHAVSTGAPDGDALGRLTVAIAVTALAEVLAARGAVGVAVEVTGAEAFGAGSGSHGGRILHESCHM
jgi:hypothetical protein